MKNEKSRTIADLTWELETAVERKASISHLAHEYQKHMELIRIYTEGLKHATEQFEVWKKDMISIGELEEKKEIRY